MKLFLSRFWDARTKIDKSMFAHYADGLHRVACVIDNTPDYDKFIADSLSTEEKAAFSRDRDLVARRMSAVKLARKEIETETRRTLCTNIEGIAFDGNTANNLREFRFLQELCAPIDLRIERSNYAMSPTRQMIKTSKKLEDAISQHIVDVFSSYIHSRETVEVGLVHQLVLYSGKFKATLLAFLQPNAVRPRLLVQANDHWPTRVAVSTVMKSLGVPRLYLQHAQVSSAFPPLDYEFSVLYNERSLRTYRDIAPTTGKIFVIGRETADVPKAPLELDRQGPCDVVIYPTARVDMNGLKKVVQALLQNPGVHNVQIKRHPRANQVFPNDFRGLSVEITDDHPAHDHVAIVGNSSVALELVSLGTPVYQCFEIDFVTRDYYAFVQSGLIPEVTTNELSSRFWKPYEINETWMSAYAEWVPAADQSAQNAKALVETISRYV